MGGGVRIERDAGDRDGTAALRERDVRAWARELLGTSALAFGVDELAGWLLADAPSTRRSWPA